MPNLPTPHITTKAGFASFLAGLALLTLFLATHTIPLDRATQGAQALAPFSTTIDPQNCSFTRTLSQGSVGEDVRCLQNYLRDVGFFPYPEGGNGQFGPVTTESLQSWQRSRNLPQDGTFGSEERSLYQSTVLGQAPAQQTPATPAPTLTTPESERITLLKHTLITLLQQLLSLYQQLLIQKTGETTLPDTETTPEAEESTAESSGSSPSSSGSSPSSGSSSGSGDGDSSSSDTTAPTLTNISASTGTSSATISWSSSEDASSLVEYGRTSSYGSTTSTSLSTARSHTLEGLTPATTYHYRVKATDVAGNEGVSSDHTFTTTALPDTTPPAAPTNLQTSAGDTQVTLTWSDPGDGDLATIVIYRGTTSGSLTEHTTVAPGTETYTDTSLTNSTTYYYTLASRDGESNESTQTSETSATPSSSVTFATTLNPTGDPIGGGPGYTGSWRTSQGLSGQGIYLEGDADYVVDTASELLAKMESYYNESTSSTVTPASPAQGGEVIFVSSDIDLTGYHLLTIPAGVTLASDRGYDNGDGTYRLGARIYIRRLYTKINGVMQIPFLQDAGADVRITGLRIQGPSAWAQKTNVNVTDQWQGGVLGIKHNTPDGTLEVDNSEIYGWDNWAIWLYRVHDDYIHHNWIHHTQREGYGYGLWPGTPHTDFVETDMVIKANLFSSHRHTIDSRATADGHEQIVSDFSNNVVADFHQRNTINNHGTQLSGGTGVAGWKRDYNENLFLDVPTPIQVSAALENTYLNVKDNWFELSNPCGPMIAGNDMCIYDPNHANYNANYKDLFADPIGDISTEGNHFNSSDRVLPLASVSVSDASPTEDESVTLTFNSSDADGHDIVFHEVIWGDGEDVIDPAHRDLTFASSIQHTFAEPGTYFVRIRAFNEHGIPSETIGQKIEVQPASSVPTFSTFVAVDWPPAVTQESGDDWTGYYKVNIQVNETTVWSKDAGNFDGWEHVVVDVSSILDQATTFTPKFEIETLQTIGDPDNTEPGGMYLYIDEMDLFNFDQARVTGSFYDTVDPTFDVDNDTFNSQWDAAITPSRKRDTRTGYGRNAYTNHGGNTLGDTNSFTKTFNILGPPGTVTGTAGDGSVTVSWTPVTVAGGYTVEWDTDASGAPYANSVNAGDISSYEITGLANGTPVYFRVRSYADDGTVSNWSSEGSETPVSGLVAGLTSFWELEEASGTRSDAHGSNDLTDTNTVTQSTGKVGNGTQHVDANNEYLKIGDGTQTGLDVGTSDFAIAFWMYVDAFDNSFNTLVHKGGGSNSADGYWITLESDGKLTAFLSDGSARRSASRGGISLGQWYFIVVNADRDGNISLSVNNGTQGTGDISPLGNADSGYSFDLGGRSVGGEDFSGRMDQVGFWNRTLTADEITCLYNSGSGRSYADISGGTCD